MSLQRDAYEAHHAAKLSAAIRQRGSAIYKRRRQLLTVEDAEVLIALRQLRTDEAVAPIRRAK
jgi:hypothetical protein